MSLNTILLIDTSEQACSIALFQEGKILAEVSHIEPRKHGDLLLSSIQSLLSSVQITPKDLTALAIITGPGAFTGIRIGVAMAQGLAYGWGLPCISVNTLEVWAATAFEADDQLQQVIVAMDARMGEVYAALYKKGQDPYQSVALLDPVCSSVTSINFDCLKELDARALRIGFIGSGIEPYREAFSENLHLDVDTSFQHLPKSLSLNAYGHHADLLLRSGETVSPLDLDALYLRPAVL